MIKMITGTVLGPMVFIATLSYLVYYKTFWGWNNVESVCMEQFKSHTWKKSLLINKKKGSCLAWVVKAAKSYTTDMYSNLKL
jgi:hypothetical protein